MTRACRVRRARQQTAATALAHYLRLLAKENARAPTFSTAMREHIRQLIFERGLSQNAFARELGWSQSTVSQLLTGNRHRKDLDVWQKIATTFGRTLSQLMAEVETRQRMARAKEKVSV